MSNCGCGGYKKKETVGKFVKQDKGEWCPSTTGPLLPTMTGWEVLYKRCASQRSRSQIGLPLLPVPKPGEHVQVFRMKRDCNKDFYFEKC